MKIERIFYCILVIFVTFTYLFFANNEKINHVPTKQPTVVKEGSTEAAVSGKKLVFSDEFNGQGLDSKNWATCYDWRKPAETGCTNAGNNEQQWYVPEQVTESNGNLIIASNKRPIDVAVQNQVKSFNYTSGMINSGRGSTSDSVKWSGTYGYFEARMKFQNGQGVWPAFWLLPIDREWPPEIDVMEFIGSKPNEILQTVHWQNGGNPQKSDVAIKNEQEFSNSWHTYGVDWKTDGIDWYIDGKKTRTYKGEGVPDKPMEIIINLAMGGTLPGKVDATTPFPNTLSVDYVRVYQSVDQARARSY